MWLEVIKAISMLGLYETPHTILHALSFFHQMTKCGGDLGPRIICLSFKMEGIWTLILYNRVSKLVFNIRGKKTKQQQQHFYCVSLLRFSAICVIVANLSHMIL